MKTKKIILQTANFDLTEIGNWYNKIDKKLTMKFLKEFREKVNYLADNPYSCEIRFNNVRIAFLKKYPFAIHYTYSEKDNKITIFSIFHTSRNPEIWKEKE